MGLSGDWVVRVASARTAFALHELAEQAARVELEAGVRAGLQQVFADRCVELWLRECGRRPAG